MYNPIIKYQQNRMSQLKRWFIMRDKLKKEEFFRNSLLFTEDCISEFEKILPEIIKQDQVKSQRVINGCNALAVYYIKKVNLEYSLGEEICKIKKSYERLLTYYSQVWNREYGYIELIRILSLGVLLRIDKSQVEPLESKIRQEKLNDYFVNFLLEAIDKEWDMTTTKFAFPNLYENIKPVIEAKDAQESLFLLKDYLENKWYQIHSETAWHNSHLSKQNTYYGYWAYEAGAVAKILDLDDEALKEQRYYPFDLVH